MNYLETSLLVFPSLKPRKVTVNAIDQGREMIDSSIKKLMKFSATRQIRSDKHQCRGDAVFCGEVNRENTELSKDT